MKRFILLAAAGVFVCLSAGGHVDGRGFGGFRGGFGGGFGGFRSGGFGGFSDDRFGGFGDDRFGGLYSGYRSFGGYSGYRGGYGLGSYDRDFTTARGGTISTAGTRGYAYGRYGGAAIGGLRDTSITTAGGRTYSGSRIGGAAIGPYGRAIGGGAGGFDVIGPRGAATGGWHTAFAGTRFPTDIGLAHYSAIGTAGIGHTTAYWSRGYMASTGGYIRHEFGYYNCFYPDWYRRYPGAWYAAGWAAGAAWTAATWPAVVTYVGLGTAPEYTYDYGSDIVYQNNNVYIGGTDAGTAAQYSQEATNLAVTGQDADAPPTADWKPLGVYALVPGDQKTSNNASNWPCTRTASYAAITTTE
jgi:hypothetical protein